MNRTILRTKFLRLSLKSTLYNYNRSTNFLKYSSSHLLHFSSTSSDEPPTPPEQKRFTLSKISIETPDSPNQENEDLPKQSLIDWRRLGVIGGTAALVLSKFKYFAVALKLTKFSSLISIGLSTAGYAFFYGWPFAAGMVGLIFIHESGHAMAMRHYNIPFSPMVFLPFMGAVVAMKDVPKNAYVEAMIAIAGPIAGSSAAVACLMGGFYTDSVFWLALGQFGLTINLFNLLPIGSLDGGRIAGAISPLMTIGGLGIGTWLAFSGTLSNPIFYLILLSGGYTVGKRMLGYDAYDPSYYKISRSLKSLIAAGYFGLIAILFGLLMANEKELRLAKSKMFSQKLRNASEDEKLKLKQLNSYTSDGDMIDPYDT